jgi:hypothetical protein
MYRIPAKIEKNFKNSEIKIYFFRNYDEKC